jgi:hypothetical protein
MCLGHLYRTSNKLDLKAFRTGTVAQPEVGGGTSWKPAKQNDKSFPVAPPAPQPQTKK